MRRRSAKTRTLQESCTKTDTTTAGRKGRYRRRKRTAKTVTRTISEDKTEITENSVRERPNRRITESKGKLSRDFIKMKTMVHRQKRTYLCDEAAVALASTSQRPMPKSTPDDSNSSTDKIGSGKAAGIATSNDQGLKWAQACCHSGLRPLLKEFASLRKFLPAGITAEVFNKNGNKNRYTDVLCLDDTRVILKGRSKDSDYIHANWVVLPSTRKYICTQGPLEETVEDFWLMVFKEKVPVIIMLCDVIEGGEAKCMEYYPTAVGKELTFGEIKVKNL